jgi:histidyl-tRNA synthetase|tara:strand:- start:474 stop:1781 length:1308 start_codon:yes stop_codon:yes gene_type:complete
MRDIEEDEYAKIEKVRIAFNDTCKIFGFKRFMPSPIEMLATLEAKSGPGIKEEIYHFKDKKQRDLGLRFDLTVGVTRYITGKKDLRRPFRVGTFGDMFRYDEPQKGRYRWFHQWNAEIYSTSNDNPSDHVLELFRFTISLFDKIGIDNFKIRLGHREIAESFVNALLYGKLEQPNNDKQQKVTTILRLLDKIEKKGDKQIVNEAINIGLEKSKAETLVKFGNIKSNNMEILTKKLFTVLQDINITDKDFNKISKVMQNYFGLFELKIKNIEFDLGLVRGMDYYDGYVFEVVDLNNKEIGSIAGGGEYTRLIKSFDGPDNLSAIGIAGGIERTMELIDENKESDNNLISVISLVKEGSEDLISTLRKNNIPTTYRQLNQEDIKKGLKFAGANNVNIVIIIGENELMDGKYRIKDMKTGKEKLVEKESIVDVIKELI